jgi:transcriptional regulator GlxA family with amidase domain
VQYPLFHAGSCQLYPAANFLASGSGLFRLIRLYARKAQLRAPPENSLDTATQVRTLLGIHSIHLARAFRRYFHVSPSEYVSRCRIWRARDLLVTSRLPLAEIALEVGFSDQSHLTNAFRRETAMTPAAYRRLHRA